MIQDLRPDTVTHSERYRRSSSSLLLLLLLQVILAGSFAFDIVDRLSGGSLNITVPDWVNTYVKNDASGN